MNKCDICSREKAHGSDSCHELVGPSCHGPTGAQFVIQVFFRELRVDFVSIFVSRYIINIYYFSRIFNSEVKRTCYSHYGEEA